MNLLSYLKDFITDTTQYFILDSHGESLKNKYKDKTYEEYCYHITKDKNRNVKRGDFFIYRRPRSSSANDLFYFFGGGVIKAIIPDPNGKKDDVIAKITHTFQFDRPLFQGDDKLENYKWKFKNKTPGTWKDFWRQYGMNLIFKEDFKDLFGEMKCITPANNLNYEFEEKEEVVCKTKKFKLEIDDDFDDNKIKIGKLGEELVMKLESKKLENTPYKPSYVAEEIGDGLGYDIKSYSDKGVEMQIEVKTTQNKNIDGFYISTNEIRVSKDLRDSYYIYRVYNLDLENGTGKIKVYKGSVSKEKFNIKPTEFKITLIK